MAAQTPAPTVFTTKPQPSSPQKVQMQVNAPAQAKPQASWGTPTPAMQARAGPADPNGPPVPDKLRTVPVGKTVLLSIVTFGIYLAVRAFKVSGDLHRMPGGSASWKTLFWLGFVPLVGLVTMLVLYYKNNDQANRLARGRVAPTMLPFILIFIPIANIAAPFVWASHYNKVAQSA